MQGVVPENNLEYALVGSIPYQPDPQPFSSTSADRKSNRLLTKEAYVNNKREGTAITKKRPDVATNHISLK